MRGEKKKKKGSLLNSPSHSGALSYYFVYTTLFDPAIFKF